jgi:hypothetical protein
MIKVVDILKENENPCWKGYRQVGMKTKNGREVPNCVPESVNESEYEDVVHQVKKFDKPKDQKLLTIKVINKLKEKRNKSNSPSNKEKLQKLIDKLESDYKKGKYITEISLDETMLVNIGDLAQKILPKDAFQIKMNSFQDADKAKERQSSMLRDLSSFLNKFYKNYNLNVRVK